MADIKKLKVRYSKAVAERQSYESILRDAYTYALPDRGVFDTITSTGQRTTRVYDSTAIIGLSVYADKIQQNLTPPWREWFKLIPGSEIDELTAEDIQPQLDAITDIIYDHLNHSNFSTKVNEAYQDAGISTGILTCEEGDGIESSLVFDSVPVEDIAIEESHNGVIENVFKKFTIKIKEIEATITNGKISQAMKDLMQKDENASVVLIEAVVKNKKKTLDHVIYWTEDDFEVASYEDDTSPYIVFRERVSSKGVYGIGRIIQLIYDIKVLNKIAEMDLTNAGLAISGVYTAADDGVINPYTITLQPGTIIPVASNNQQNPSLRPLDRPGDFSIAQLKMEQKQDLINKTLLNQPLGEVSRTPVRTLGEVQERVAENTEITQASFSRFQTELLEKLIKRIVDVLKQAGKIQPIVVDGKEITIKFTSPLAKQQDLEDINTIVNYAGTLQATGVPAEAVGTDIKFEAVPKYIAQQMGMPSELIRTPEEKNAYVLQQKQARQAQVDQETQDV